MKFALFAWKIAISADFCKFQSTKMKHVYVQVIDVKVCVMMLTDGREEVLTV